MPENGCKFKHCRAAFTRLYRSPSPWVLSTEQSMYHRQSQVFYCSIAIHSPSISCRRTTCRTCELFVLPSYLFALTWSHASSRAACDKKPLFGRFPASHGLSRFILDLDVSPLKPSRRTASSGFWRVCPPFSSPQKQTIPMPRLFVH